MSISIRLSFLFAVCFLTFSACHPSVSKNGKSGLQLKSAKAIEWTTGPNGFEGITYEISIENPKEIELEVLAFWVNGIPKNMRLNTHQNEFVLSLTYSDNSKADDLIKAENPINQKAAGVVKYQIGTKVYYWIIDEFKVETPTDEHLPH